MLLMGKVLNFGEVLHSFLFITCAFGVQSKNAELNSGGFLHVCRAEDVLRALHLLSKDLWAS